MKCIEAEGKAVNWAQIHWWMKGSACEAWGVLGKSEAKDFRSAGVEEEGCPMVWTEICGLEGH